MNRSLGTLNVAASILVYLFCLAGLAGSARAEIAIRAPNVEAKLYLGPGARQPLIVGFGGSEGGNAWSSDRWKPARDRFLADGFAFLAVGYFGAPGTPPQLDRISLDQVHAAIVAAGKHARVDGSRVGLVGGSRGGDLALLLASHFPGIRCVAAIAASSVVFPTHVAPFEHAAWTLAGAELPFVPVTEAAVPFLQRRDLLGAFTAMLADPAAVARAAIPVENIAGPVLLLTGRSDEIVPSTEMAHQIMARLARHRVRHARAHHAFVGGHGAPLDHLDLVHAFVNERCR